MCLAIPAQIVEFVDADNQIAKVDVSGVRRNVSVALLADETVNIGDWVLIHVGFAMTKVDEAEALATRALLESLGKPFDDELEELRSSAIE